MLRKECLRFSEVFRVMLDVGSPEAYALLASPPAVVLLGTSFFFGSARARLLDHPPWEWEGPFYEQLTRVEVNAGLSNS